MLNVVHGDKVAVDALLAHPGISAVSFVGSTPIARHIHTTASANGKRVQALGGAKNHMLVLPDADLDAAADAAVSAAYGSAGERCMAISAVVAVGAIGDELVEKIRERAEKIKIGPGSDPASEMGPLITAAHRDKVAGYVKGAADQGADVVLDGTGYTVDGFEKGHWIGLSLLDNVKTDSDAYRDEIFGPVLCVLRAETYEEGVALINASPFGNGTAIFTRDGGAARRFQLEIEAGMVGVNVPIPVPVGYHSFGGWKDSLFGDHHVYGNDGIHFYTRGKVVTTRWPDPSEGHIGVDLGFPATTDLTQDLTQDLRTGSPPAPSRGGELRSRPADTLAGQRVPAKSAVSSARSPSAADDRARRRRRTSRVITAPARTNSTPTAGHGTAMNSTSDCGARSGWAVAPAEIRTVTQSDCGASAHGSVSCTRWPGSSTSFSSRAGRSSTVRPNNPFADTATSGSTTTLPRLTSVYETVARASLTHGNRGADRLTFTSSTLSPGVTGPGTRKYIREPTCRFTPTWTLPSCRMPSTAVLRATIPPTWSPGVASWGTFTVNGTSLRPLGGTVTVVAASGASTIHAPTSLGFWSTGSRAKAPPTGVFTASVAKTWKVSSLSEELRIVALSLIVVPAAPWWKK